MLYPSQCQCADGYGGSDCATFLDSSINKLKISSPELVLTANPYEPKLILPDPRYPDRKTWTNKIDWAKIAVSIPATYDAPLISNESRQKQTYIDMNASKIGIERVEFSAELRRGTQKAIWSSTRDCQFKSFCQMKLDETDIRTTQWNNILKGGYPTPFNHLDLVVVTINMKNGGIVSYRNREQNDRQEHYSIKGTTVNKTLELQFDLNSPDHCMEDANPCSEQPLVTPDFTKQTSFDVTWNGWSDKDSGLQTIHFQLVPLKIVNAKLNVLASDGTPAFATSVDPTKGAAIINMTVPGPYYLEMSVSDRAENEKSTRRIFIFDDKSKVSLSGEAPLVKTADENTNYQWINKQADKIEVIWRDRFQNEMHWTNGWLNAVTSLDHIPRKLDDTGTISKRTTSKIKNIQGIVKFTIGYDVRYDLKSTPQIVDFVTVPDDMFDEQMMTIKEELKDGKRLTFKIRGYDVMDNFEEDNTTVTIDRSSPVIKNVLLTKDGIVNTVVHSEEELKRLISEWEVYDVHSGIHSISWRIFDNCTHTGGITYGSIQERKETLRECEQKNANFSRRSSCYCTPFNGCFSRHFTIIPSVTTNKYDKILAGMDTGVFKSGYFIEVTAVNSAFLASISVLKITTAYYNSTHEAPDDGNYHVTVAVYNQKLDYSNLVCSEKISGNSSDSNLSNDGVKFTPNKDVCAKLFITFCTILMEVVRNEI